MRVLLLLTLLIGSVTKMVAGDGDYEQATLRNLKTFSVVVEDLNPEAVSDGLTTDQIKTDVELRLRKAGVTVVGSSIEHLYVNAHLLKGKAGIDGLYAYNVEVAFFQPVTVRLNNVLTVANTWSVAYIGTIGRANMPRGVRDDIGDLVDKFLNAYLSVNPK